MSRFRRFKNDVRTGWAKVRQGTAKVADRSLEEMEFLRLKFQLYKVEDQIKEHLRAAGERAFQLIEVSRSNLVSSGQAPQSLSNRGEIATLPLVARNDSVGV